MLSTTQIDHFRTFGFVVLGEFLVQHTVQLRDDVDTSIRNAYAATHDRGDPIPTVGVLGLEGVDVG